MDTDDELQKMAKKVDDIDARLRKEMDDDIQKLIKKVDDLDNRLRKVEQHWHVTLAIAAILAVGGGFIGTTLYETTKQVAALKTDTADLTKTVPKLRDEALGQLDKAKLDAVATLKKSASMAVDSFRSTAFEHWLKEERATRESRQRELEVTISSLQGALKEERQQREAKDAVQTKWLRNIYQQAASTGMPKHEGANGWWQSNLIAGNAKAQEELAK